ncbi:bifunctional phosphoribosyl-AMP cyclohydrolase/phosphoribosyl-ATP diphosphatase HisIE [Candidatus Pantoea edessiphila]|uniref:Histidine biosynthesis bifunctional protein HisIE n=1 Tax=Candidatus Pantoea edessiphila TaxID=2044610 RepID=A0A2P5SWL5_9GAMM|nr:bifunctional phosphoribosyl-AMP cyclohydrolase/phosphoribosyl-ATP diphosphatase HisIE [Candidatus Pantoea edessiphila]PPI86738.1 bifunctional phosphoribosyl-AMP cyclohydrolase/phosphoribosyl-ATP diphosphatase [Candidatus Pantoea edessiphila]
MINAKEISCLNWEKTQGMIPTIIQDYISSQVLMHGYMNQQALKKSLEQGIITFFSRTKNCLWTKGETSGNLLKLIDITIDCDKDTLLILVNPVGPTCHLGNYSCFCISESNWSFFYRLEKLLAERKKYHVYNSYTSKLYASGTKRIAQKVGEEAVECALAAVTNNHQELINEASDLIYHLLILLQDQGIDFNMIVNNLKKRNINNNSI